MSTQVRDAADIKLAVVEGRLRRSKASRLPLLSCCFRPPAVVLYEEVEGDGGGNRATVQLPPPPAKSALKKPAKDPGGAAPARGRGCYMAARATRPPRPS